RLLTFTLLWGALLSAFALALTLGPNMSRPKLDLCLVLVLLSAVSYLGEHVSAEAPVAGARTYLEKNLSQIDYLTNPRTTGIMSYQHDQANLVHDPGYWWSGCEPWSGQDNICFVPSLYPGDILRMEGRVLLGSPGVHLDVYLDNQTVYHSALPPGPFK